MPIKELKGIRRLPRQGHIRLGHMIPSGAGKKSYPKEAGFFRIDPQMEGGDKVISEFKRLYGDEPRSIDIVFPLDDPELVFPQYYKMYKKSGDSGVLFCKGDGEMAIHRVEQGMEERQCKGENCDDYIARDCRRVGTLQVMLPKIPGIGIFQINTTSWNSIISLNSCMDYIRALCGRIAMIPLKLELVHQDTQTIIEGAPKVTKHWIMQLDIKNLRLADLQIAAQIPATQVALPAPDESRDELLFSGDSGQPIGEGKTIRPPQAKKKPEVTYEVKPGEAGVMVADYLKSQETGQKQGKTPRLEPGKGGSKGPQGKGQETGKTEAKEANGVISESQANLLSAHIARKVIGVPLSEAKDMFPENLAVKQFTEIFNWLVAQKKEIEPSDFLKKLAEIRREKVEEEL